MFGLVKYPFEVTEPVLGNHRTDVRIGLKSFNRRGQNGPGSKFLGASQNHIIKLFVLRLVDDKLLKADTILTSVLAVSDSVKCARVRTWENVQDTTHPDTDVSVQVCPG
jgi:hypothetical protein